MTKLMLAVISNLLLQSQGEPVWAIPAIKAFRDMAIELGLDDSLKLAGECWNEAVPLLPDFVQRVTNKDNPHARLNWQNVTLPPPVTLLVIGLSPGLV